LNDARPKRAWILCKTAQNAGFAQAPHPSFSFPKEERTTSVQHSVETVALLRCAVASQQNVLICGDPVTGKEEAMAATISDTDRIALIEETSEILLEEPNYVHS
jgi:type IV secretory pathway ATPase VirB11/archaellum biosynthesis ATPase